MATTSSGFTTSTILDASLGVMCPVHGLPKGLITDITRTRTPWYCFSIPSKYSVSAVYPMSPASGILNLKPTASESVCRVSVETIFVFSTLNLTPGFTVTTSFIMFWWYVEIAGPTSLFPARMFDGAAMVPLFLSMPRVMASTSTSALAQWSGCL